MNDLFVANGWSVCGKCMIHLWQMYDLFLANEWSVCGKCMIHSWQICLWQVCDQFVANEWSVSGSQSLEVLDLQSSLDGMSKSQWSKLCHLLAERPSLAFLSLKKCKIRGSQGTWNIYSYGVSCCQRQEGTCFCVAGPKTGLFPQLFGSDICIYTTWKVTDHVQFSF